MQRLLILPFLVLATNCAGTLDLEPVAQRLEDAKQATVTTSAAFHALYDGMCSPEHPLAPGKLCADAAEALALGDAISHDALNKTIAVFNELNKLAQEAQ